MKLINSGKKILFNGIYNDAKPSERVKYGVLNLANK